MSNLRGDSDAFKHVKQFVLEEHGGDTDKYQLLLRKGVFCYSHLKSMDVLNERELPPIEAFFDDLNEQPCSASDYAHVQRMWEVFKMESMKDLLELYVKLDVLLLDAVFQRYRKEALSAYGLDPLHFYTAPGLSNHHFSCSPKILTKSHRYRIHIILSSLIY